MASDEEDYEYWEDKVTALQRTQLDTVNAAATAWRTLFGALLGIFTAVAFAGGLTTIDNLAQPWDSIMKVATLVALVLAIGATYFANRASGSISVELIHNQDPLYLRNRTANLAAEARTNLGRAKPLGVLAVGIVIAGSAIVLLIGPAKPGAPDVLLVQGGQATCGSLARQSGRLTVGTTPLSANVSQMTIVSSCP
jgi:hypothetical protein